MSPSLPPDAAPELLLSHAAWIRRLAARLVHDGDRADELAQETWTRLLERPPELDRPFRGWIATVMRNLVRAEVRGRARRDARERAHAPAEATASSHELVERAALQRELVQAVMELDEPYRTVVLLRYFEDLSPTAIAARERIPLATVKTRLQRGLARLRERLARTHAPDGRANALVALAALADPDTVPLSLVASLVMNAKLLVPLAALVLSGWFLFNRTNEPDARAEAPLEAERKQDLAHADAPAGPGAPAAARREGLAPSPATHTRDSAPASPAAGTTVAGWVIDVEGRPVAELELGFAPLGPDRTPRESEARTSLGRSAADGSFELTVPGPGRLFARDERWVTVLSGLPVAAERAPRAYVVVAPRLELSGLVVDEGGAPLANVSVVLAPPSDLRARLSVVLDFSDPQEFVAVSDDAGRFRIERAPLLRDGTLSARVSGRIPFRESSPVSSRHDLVLVLPREENSNERLRGLVLGPRGEPLPDARVAYGLDTVHTDAEGRFEFDLHDERSMNRRARAWVTVPDDRLTALLPGFLPGEVVAERRDSEGQPLWPDPLVIRLDGTPLALAGRVVDERGTGLSGIRVWLADGTFFGAVRPEGQRDYPDFAEVEGLLAGAEPGWNYATTGADGAFRLEGLLVRDYALAAMDTSSLLRTVTEGLAAGREDIELVLDTGRLLRLAGLVVDGRGEPVSGVSIFPMCDAFEAKVAGQTIGTTHEAAPGVVTGADGRFALERVPATLAYLRLQGSETLPLEWGRGLAGGLEELADGRAEDLCITLERRCHFRIELVDPSQADECAMVDEDGRELVISDFQGASRNDTERHALLGGRSNTLAVSDRARELVLYLGGVAVRRVPVTLLPGEPLVLTP